MSKVVSYICDHCGKAVQEENDPLVMAEAMGCWFVLSRVSGRSSEHFCSLDCLALWYRVTKIASVLLDPDLEAIREGYRTACARHPKAFTDPHQGFAIIKEEVDELWDAVRRSKFGVLTDEMVVEAVHVGAMVLRFLKLKETKK